MDLVPAMRRIRAFEPLPEADLRVLEKAFNVESHGDSHVFVREGDRASSAWLIAEGEVVVTRDRASSVDEITVLGPGDLFGLIGLVSGRRRSATCTTRGPVTVGVIDGSAFEWLLDTHAPMGHALQRAVAEQLARDYRQIQAHLVAELERRSAR